MSSDKDEHENSGDTPITGSGEDTAVDLYDILPFELWETILAKLNPRSDLLNCLEAFPELNIAARPLRTIYLLNQVLPLVYPWLKFTDLLLLRSGCKFYAESVDGFIKAENSRRLLRLIRAMSKNSS